MINQQHNVLLNTTNAWTKRFQREQHRGGKWKTTTPILSILPRNNNNNDNMKQSQQQQQQQTSTLYYNTTNNTTTRNNKFDSNILFNTLLKQTKKETIQLNTLIKPLTATLNGTNDDKVTRERTKKKHNNNPTINHIANIFKSTEYTTSSLLIFKINNFFMNQIDINDIQKTGRTFDLIYNLGIALKDQTFINDNHIQEDQENRHEQEEEEESIRRQRQTSSFDINAWRHAVLAGIVPRSLKHAMSINGHLYGMVLNMLEKFCKSNYTIWKNNQIILKALGVLFYFINQTNIIKHNDDDHLDEEMDTSSYYDMILLKQIPIEIIIYFLKFVTLEKYSIRLEKQLSLLYANRIGKWYTSSFHIYGNNNTTKNNGMMVNQRRNDLSMRHTLMELFQGATSPTTQGIMYYYLLQHIGNSFILVENTMDQRMTTTTTKQQELYDHVISELACSGFIVILHNYMIVVKKEIGRKITTTTTTTNNNNNINMHENHFNSLINQYLFGDKRTKAIIHKKTNIDIYIHKVVRYKKVKMEIARSILKFIQEIVKCIHEFLEKEQMNESNTMKIQNNNNILLHSKKTLLLQKKYDDDTNIIMAKEIEKELYHSNLIMIDNMENGKDKNHVLNTIEKDTPHLLLRAVFGRKSLSHLKNINKKKYLIIIKDAIDIARKYNQDVVDTAVELLLNMEEEKVVVEEEEEVVVERGDA